MSAETPGKGGLGQHQDGVHGGEHTVRDRILPLVHKLPRIALDLVGNLQLREVTGQIAVTRPGP